MTTLVRVELLKLRTLRSSTVTAGIALALAGALGVGRVLVAADQDQAITLADVARAPLEPVWFAVIVLAVLASAGEFQHRTVRTTLLTTPDRVRVVAAKAAAAAITGAVLTGAAMALAALTGTVAAVLGSTSLPAGGVDAWGPAGGGLALGAVWAVLAAAIGVLTRSTAAAIGAVLLWRFVVESVAPVVLRMPELYGWTPSGAADALLGTARPELLPVTAAIAVLAGWVAVLCGGAVAAFLRRDPA